MGEATLSSSKPKVLVLGGPLDYIDKQYREDFEKDYVLDVWYLQQVTYVQNRLMTTNRFSMPKTVAKQSPPSPTKSPKMGLSKLSSSRW